MPTLHLDGFRDFWGKKMGRFFAGAMQHLDPIGLAEGEGLRKIMNSSGSAGLGARLAGYGRNFEATMAARQAAGGARYRLSDYFSGLNVEDFVGGRGRRVLTRAGEDLASTVRSRRMAWRLGVPMAAGAAVGASALFGDNPVSRTIGAAGTAAGVGMGATLMTRFGGKAGPFAAAGLVGWAGVNMLRSGNQMGPF